MSDNQTVERVKIARQHSAIGSATVVLPVFSAPATSAPPTTADAGLPPDEALQVLSLAQRTAENHITAANRHAQTVRAEAQASAEQIKTEARSYADQVRAEADRLLDDARATFEQRRRDADTEAEEVRQQAAAALADARAAAAQIVADGRERAEQSDLRARHRYEDAVGSLEIKREALQKQIETLVVFDADYRHQLASFMHTQLRVLWGERSEAAGEQLARAQLPGGPVGAADRI
ncbi:ElaB/YqjD/DUF883 family membrane-anchored ribosome-binding protein [Actinoplanes tereljensis]|uniref:hypothetical protein n=1 Tax=Paractinoplanes tereljensis TaxID=571912 RepID=UPI003393245A